MKKRRKYVLVIAAVIFSVMAYNVLKYPQQIKSVNGPDSLVAELWVEPHIIFSINLPKPVFLGQLLLTIPLLLFGDIHNNVEMNLIVRKHREVLLKDQIVIMGDMVIDHDDTELVWVENELTVIEEHTKKVKTYSFQTPKTTGS